MKLICACAATALLVTAGVPSPAAQARDPLALGLIRPDGILLPVAVLDTGQWIDPRPDSGDAIHLDRMIEALPSYWRERRQQVPQLWHIATSPSEPLTAAKVATHVVYGEHCGHQVGLLTDVRRVGGDTFRRKLAMSRPMPYAMPAAVDPADTEWKPLIARVYEEAALQEAATIARQEKHAGRSSELEPLPERSGLRLRRLFGHRSAGARTLYYEAERTYEKPMFPGGRAEPHLLAASGWIHAQDGAAPSVLHRHALVSTRTFTTPQTITPLAILTIDGATVWAVIEHGYENETLTILQVEPGVRRALIKPIGGC